MSVCRDLSSPLNPAGGVLHEIHRPIGSAPTNEIRDHQFGISINSDPCPNIAPADFLFLGCYILGFCTDICPYFVTLESAYRHIAHVLIVEGHACLAEINQKFCNRA